MRLLIIRHGESEADLLNVHEGRADYELTPKGHAQAKAMSEWIANKYTVNKIYCSPLKRAYQTASYLSQQVGIPLIVEEKLMEFNNGLIAGLSRDKADKEYPFVENVPIHAAVYKQESKLEFRFRADFVLSKIMSENPFSDTIAIVSHGGMINQLFLSFIRAPIDCGVSYCTGDTGIHEWVVENQSKKIVFSNSQCHTL